jgi:hypothetical protein
MKPLHRSVALTLLALVCGACLAVGCAQILGIEDLPDGCDTDADCRADAPICGEDNKCRGCGANRECEDSAAPICGENGQCMPGCMTSAECDGVTPICNGVGGCESCDGDDDACARLAMGTPYCATEGAIEGACVACVDSTQCDESAPICSATNTCDRCKEHSDCAAFSGICSDDGACAPESAVIHVSSNENSSDTGACTKQQPCATITGARDKVQADATKRFIRVLDSEAYNGDFVLSNVTVSIIGNNASISGIRNGTPAIEIAASANVTLDGLTIKANGTGSDGILCQASNSQLTLKNVTVLDSSGLGVEVSGCPLTVERSVIKGNDGGGISVTSAGFDITNSYIMGNGSANAEAGGVIIVNATSRMPQRFAFNTVIDNAVGGDAPASGVSCTVPAPDNDNGKLIATSNIIGKDASSLLPSVSGNCEWHYSNIEAGDMLGDIASATNNNNYGDCALMDTGSGVPAITAGSLCDNTGQPGTGIVVDYDGAPRSADTPDMGADEL